MGALSRFGRAPPSSDRRAPHWPCGWWLARPRLSSSPAVTPHSLSCGPSLDSGPLFNLRRATSSLHCKISTCFWRGAGCTQFMPGAAHRLRGLGPLVNQSVINLESPARFCLLRSCHVDSTRIKSTPTNAFLCRCTAPRGAVTSYPTSFCSPCRHRPSLTGLVFLRRRLEAVVILCCILPVLFLRAFIARSVASACSIPACVSHHFRCE